MNYSLYCFEDEMPICLGCNAVEQEEESKKKNRSAHEGHFVKSL